MRAAWAAAAGVLLAACGSSGPSLLMRSPSAYLLTLDGLRTPGFTAVEPAHSLPGEACDAATARYFRGVPDLATANGPIDVRTTVLRCASVGSASSAYSGLVRRVDGVSGETPESAGVLGDAAHADSLQTSSDGVGLVEVTVTWRSVNLVSVLVMRERDAGDALPDALILAHAQEKNLS